MQKYVVRLKVKEFLEAQDRKNIATEKELASKMKIAPSQLWRAKLPVEDENYNSPGNQFIAGVLKVFGGNFQDYFYIDEISLRR
ncbi:hypothetical protein [Paenibacillus chitinolyticus]